MEKMKTFGYKYSKTEGKFIQISPKAKTCQVVEEMHWDDSDQSITHHKIVGIGGTFQMKAHCVFDRGPKLQTLISRASGLHFGASACVRKL